ncbi:MAG TPA: hypothetical protein VFK44_09535 [Bacillales bacterium]|nr:hypothetical protein [Bacillales bacterium]
MKKIPFLAFSAFLLLGLFACSNQNGQESNNADPNTDYTQEQSNTKKDVREVVWGQLSEPQKERINGTWEDGKVSTVTLRKNMMNLVKDKAYEGKEVYAIDFPTNDKSRSPNNMIVYADKDTFKYIGEGLVD